MVKEYTCEKCGKVFSQKCHFTNHLNRKRPCKPVKYKVIEEKVQEKLQELAKIFYNLVEHMQQLLQDQGKLRDQVVGTSTQDYQKMQEESMLHQGQQNQLKEILYIF